MSDFVVVIPARYASTRLPGKPLLELHGKPLLQHVWERGCETSAREVIVATDDERIALAAESFGATVCMTSTDHQSGTDRIAEVSEVMDWPDQLIVVNLQGDEPSMPSALVEQCATLLQNSDADIATLASPFVSQADFENPNCVKVICDAHGRALYFSRATIPYAQDGDHEGARLAALHHHGIYSYRCGRLRHLVHAPVDRLEAIERLEQLRALALGMTIVVGVPECRPGAGVDTPADLERAWRELAAGNR